jgi:aminoglycoside phosphotransferase (APT) family kinase protein
MNGPAADPGLAHLAALRRADNERRDAPDAAFIAELRQRYPTEREFDAMLTRKLQRRSLPRRAGVTLEAFAACLQAFLHEQRIGPFELQDLAWMSGGGSKIQLRFTLRWNDPARGGRATATRLVARLEPQESLSATSRRREAQLLRAFEGTLPVPRVYWVDADGRWFPEPTLIYAFAEGVTKPSQAAGRVGGVGSRFDGGLRESLARQFVEHLALIHTFDLGGRDFSAFDLPELGSGQTALWQLNRARRIWEEDRGEELPLMEVAANWLQRNLPPLDRVSVLHGDYRSGNFLFDEASGRITAWLDWERGYLGDRHRDLAWITLPLFGRYDDDGRTLLVSGLLPLQRFYDEYQRVSGLSIDPARLRYYRVLNAYQLIASSLGTAYRVARLGRSHQDVLLTWIEGIVYQLADDLRRHLNEEDA